MNKVLPYLAFCVAGLGILVHYGTGLPLAAFPFLLATFVIATVGMFFVDPDRPVSARLACGLAVAMAAAPFGVPYVQAYRISLLEAQRARETAPLYAELEEEFDSLRPYINEYYNQYGLFPDLRGEEFLPFVDADGQLQARPEMAGLYAPRDPFASNNERVRWWAVPGRGVMVLSVGQDGARELPLPGVAMDGPPAHPLHGLANLGIDPRWALYDPTNGALGLGDLALYHGRGDLGQALAELYDAWDEAHGETTWDPAAEERPNGRPEDRQSVRDAEAAAELYADGKPLAALVLAARSISQRPQYEAQWTGTEIAADRVRGLALYQLAAYREAADALNVYTSRVPNDAGAHYFLAAALFRGGDRAHAELHLAAAAQISLNDPVADRAQAGLDRLRRNQDPGFPVPWILEQTPEAPREP